MNVKVKGYALGALAAAAYGMNPLFALTLYKDGMDPYSVLFFRYLFAIPILGIMLKARGRSFALARRDIVPLVVMGLLLSLSSLSLFLSYNYMEAGIASTLLFVYPIMVAMIMVIFFHERITALTASCILVALVGIALLYRGSDGATLDLLVENLGRINYGPLVGRDPKGLPLGVGICWQMLSHFEVWNLELDNLDQVRYGAFGETENLPAFHRGEFEIDTPADTFLEFPGVKGVVWINGFNIGRYWNIGPGNTLYVPAPLLKPGRNEVVVLELHKLKESAVLFTDRPQLD